MIHVYYGDSFLWELTEAEWEDLQESELQAHCQKLFREMMAKDLEDIDGRTSQT